MVGIAAWYDAHKQEEAPAVRKHPGAWPAPLTKAPACLTLRYTPTIGPSDVGWVRVDDSFYDHPKFGEAGPVGIALWITGLAWSNRNLTDGFIPRHRVNLLLSWEGVAWRMWMGDLFGGGEDVEAELVAKHLVEVGLWEETDSGYQIHDYLEYQPSAEQVNERRQKDRTRKKSGEVESAKRAVSNPRANPRRSPAESAHVPNGIPPDSEVPQTQSHTQPQETQEPLAAAPPKTDIEVRRTRKSDLVWESLLAVCGVDPTQVTSTARGRYNKAAKDLRDLGATPEAIAARGLVFRQRWPDASLTPSALASRWGECDPDRQHATVARRDPERDMLRAQARGLEA